MPVVIDQRGIPVIPAVIVQVIGILVLEASLEKDGIQLRIIGRGFRDRWGVQGIGDPVYVRQDQPVGAFRTPRILGSEHFTAYLEVGEQVFPQVLVKIDTRVVPVLAEHVRIGIIRSVAETDIGAPRVLVLIAVIEVGIDTRHKIHPGCEMDF